MATKPSELALNAQLTRIGKYDVVDLLGRGGMGEVYRCIDSRIGREVAVKTLTEGFMDDSEMLARFYEEGRNTGRLKHPHIVTVYDVGEHNGMPYIVMECVDGVPLDKSLQSEDPLTDRLRILEQVCSALGYAQGQAVIHRDVKPANIFVQKDRTAKLLDFGIARLEKRDQDIRLTRTGSIVGTTPYMAPERLRNGNVDARSDIFSAGIVLYELVTGQLPFSGERNVIIQKILGEPHPPLSAAAQSLPAGLEMVVDRALAKTPELRYATAEEMEADLHSVILELQQEQVGELMAEAHRLVEAGELSRAKLLLLRVQKIDGKHAEARQLIARINQQTTDRQREERRLQILRQAEDALLSGQIDQSLATVDDGLAEFEGKSEELVLLRENIRKEKEKQDRINQHLRQAEAARRRGDFPAAKSAAEKALTFDTRNAKILGLVAALDKEAEEAQRQAQARGILEAARVEINARRFEPALALLAQAENIDPANPETQLLRRDALAGQEQLRRREIIAQLEDEAAQAVSADQLQVVSRRIQEAMTAMPAEAALFRLNSQIERQLRDHDNRRLVDETVQACRDLGPREALELVRAARQRLPSDERLLALEGLLTERFRQQNVEDRRAEYLMRAREALKTGEYSDAVRILEFCQAEGIATGEVLSLLDFARNEEAEHHRQVRLRESLAQAQAFLRDEAYDEAIRFLEQATQQIDDSALRLLLDQAIAGRESLRQQVESALASAGKLVRAGKLPEALQLLKVQSMAVRRSDSVQTTLLALQEELQQAAFRAAGRAYAQLETDLPGGAAWMTQAAAASGQSAFFARMNGLFRDRSRSVADRKVSQAIQQGKTLLRDHDKTAAASALQGAATSVAFAAPELQTQWRQMQDKLAKTTLISRLRG
jgi:serine/threonine-protein kinase